MRWLLASFVAVCVGVFVLICLVAYNILDSQPIEIETLDVTMAQEQKVMSQLFEAAAIIFSANELTQEETIFLRPDDVNALISCAMKWDKGVQSVASKQRQAGAGISEGFSETWGIVFKNGKFHLSIHYEVLDPGMFSYMIGSHLNGSMVFSLRYGKHGVIVDVDRLQLSNIEVPPVLGELFENHLISLIRTRIQPYEGYQKCLSIMPRGHGLTVSYKPYLLQKILKTNIGKVNNLK